MSESKFTPGPWEVDVGESHAVRDTNGGLVAGLGYTARRFGPLRTSENVAANAALIAAAPELYEALKAAVEIIDKWIEPETMGVVRSGDGVLGHYLRDEYLANFRAALLKATPEQS